MVLRTGMTRPCRISGRMIPVSKNVMHCAESFLNWRIYWLALAWLIEETVRYGLLFWYAQLQSQSSCLHSLPATTQI